MTATTVDLTPAEKDELVGGPHGEPYPIPDEAEFDDVGLGRLSAYDVERIARRLMARPDLPIGHLNRFNIMFVWAKTGGTSGGKPRWGSVALANPDLKHVTMKDEGQAADAVVRLAADNLRDAHATRWQVANELCFLLCRIGLYTTQEGGDERLTLVAPDAAFFTPQMRLFGPQTPELKKTILDIRQARFDWADWLADDIAKAEAAKDFDPSLDLPAGVASEAGPADGGAPGADWTEPAPQLFDADGMYVGPEDDDLPWAGVEMESGDWRPTDDALTDEPGPITDDARDAGAGEAQEPWEDPRPQFGRPMTGDELAATEEARDRIEAKKAKVRANFLTEIGVDGGEVCKLCGVDVFDHDPETCAGGTPETRKDRSRKSPKNRSGAQDTGSEGLGVSGESTVLGQRSDPGPDIWRATDDLVALAESRAALQSNGNGGHDRADAAGILLDPDRVCLALTAAGWKIAAEGMVADLGEGDWTYVDPETGEQYETAKVERAYRAALAGGNRR